jgi:hypothetical protein
MARFLQRLLAVLCALLFAASSSGGLFSKSDEELLEKALTSDDPKKVSKVLDDLIERRNYMAVLKIRQYARRKIGEKRSKLLRKGRLDEKTIEKELKPWVAVRNKATNAFVQRDTHTVGTEH